MNLTFAFHDRTRVKSATVRSFVSLLRKVFFVFLRARWIKRKASLDREGTREHESTKGNSKGKEEERRENAIAFLFGYRQQTPDTHTTPTPTNADSTQNQKRNTVGVHLTSSTVSIPKRSIHTRGRGEKRGKKKETSVATEQRRSVAKRTEWKKGYYGEHIHKRESGAVECRCLHVVTVLCKTRQDG